MQSDLHHQSDSFDPQNVSKNGKRTHQEKKIKTKRAQHKLRRSSFFNNEKYDIMYVLHEELTGKTPFNCFSLQTCNLTEWHIGNKNKKIQFCVVEVFVL